MPVKDSAGEALPAPPRLWARRESGSRVWCDGRGWCLSNPSSTLFLLGVNPPQHPRGGTEAAPPYRRNGNLFVSPSEGLRGLLGAWVSAERRGHGCDDFVPATCHVCLEERLAVLSDDQLRGNLNLFPSEKKKYSKSIKQVVPLMCSRAILSAALVSGVHGTARGRPTVICWWLLGWTSPCRRAGV